MIEWMTEWIIKTAFLSDARSYAGGYAAVDIFSHRVTTALNNVRSDYAVELQLYILRGYVQFLQVVTQCIFCPSSIRNFIGSQKRVHILARYAVNFYPML